MQTDLIQTDDGASVPALTEASLPNLEESELKTGRQEKELIHVWVFENTFRHHH